MTEQDITKLLAARHSKDVFVAQCKNGSSYGPAGTMIKLDAWAMKRSWAHPCLSGYEIKISRSDFLQDHKWVNAIEFCNEFWWVAPEGIMDPSEISQDSGLLIVSKNCARLHVKKRAVYRAISDPCELLYYVLMCRSVIVRNTWDQQISKADKWRNWLITRDEEKEIGWNVSRKIRELVAKRITEVAEENKLLRCAVNRYDEIAPLLEKYNMAKRRKSERGDVFVPDDLWSVRGRMEKLQESVPSELIGMLRDVARKLEAIRNKEISE